jgi:hypothetical protein
MHKMVLFWIAALASLVSAAITRTPEPEPAWRKSALAFVPAGYVGAMPIAPESHDGVRGWWRGLCSNQVTNCS